MTGERYTRAWRRIQCQNTLWHLPSHSKPCFNLWLGFLFFFIFFFSPHVCFPESENWAIRPVCCALLIAAGRQLWETWQMSPGPALPLPYTWPSPPARCSTVRHAVSALLCSELHGALCHWQHLSALIKHLETSANPSAAGEGWAPSAACSACSLPAFFLHHSYAAPTVKCLWVTAKASVLSSHADCFITLRSRKALTFG